MGRLSHRRLIPIVGLETGYGRPPGYELVKGKGVRTESWDIQPGGRSVYNFEEERRQ